MSENPNTIETTVPFQAGWLEWTVLGAAFGLLGYVVISARRARKSDGKKQ